jgi:hypothetical protein
MRRFAPVGLARPLACLRPASASFAQLNAAETPLADLRGLFRTPDGSKAAALARQLVLVLHGATGRELARLPDFVSPDAIVFGRAR